MAYIPPRSRSIFEPRWSSIFLALTFFFLFPRISSMARPTPFREARLEPDPPTARYRSESPGDLRCCASERRSQLRPTASMSRRSGKRGIMSTRSFCHVRTSIASR